VDGVYTTVVGVVLGIASWHMLRRIFKLLGKLYSDMLDNYLTYLDDLARTRNSSKKKHKQEEVVAAALEKLKKEDKLLDMLRELSRFPTLSIQQNRKSASGAIYEDMFRRMQIILRRLLTSQEMLYYNTILELITKEAIRKKKD